MRFKPDLLLGVTLDRKFFADIKTVCHHLIQTPAFQYEPFEEMKYTLLLAIFEYWMFADWAGIEFFLEMCRDTDDEMIRCRDIPTIRRLTEVRFIDYPRAYDGAKSLSRETDQLTGCFYIKEHMCDEVYGGAVVRICFDV